jgi:hypothetical protein
MFPETDRIQRVKKWLFSPWRPVLTGGIFQQGDFWKKMVLSVGAIKKVNHFCTQKEIEFHDSKPVRMKATGSKDDPGYAALIVQTQTRDTRRGIDRD